MIVLAAAGAVSLGAVLVEGCDQGTNASPTFAVPEGGTNDNGLCPKVEPNFDSIANDLLASNTCGATRGGHCHSAGGAENSGGLDFSVSTDVMYAELVGDGGSLAHANNSDGDDHTLFRVVPGDAGASFLYLKLVTQSGTDPHYGSGMPFDCPGQLRPADIEAVKTWIDDGAPFVASDAGTGGNEDAGPADAGSDSGADAGDGG